MSQPSVSARIRALEHRLGLQLLVRCRLPNPRLTAPQLSRTPFFMREPGSGTREAFTAAIVGAGCSEPAVVAELGSTAAVREAAAAGLGPAPLSELAVRAELATGRLVSVKVSGVDLTRRFRAVWNGTREPPSPIRELVAVARSRE